MTSQIGRNGLRPGVRYSRIVIADDYPLFRSALVQMLDAPPDLEVVGDATNGREAVELCRRLRPDLRPIPPALRSEAMPLRLLRPNLTTSSAE
jgi:hypothetical protein